MEKTEEEKKVKTMILSLSEENKKCAIAAAEALLYTQSNGVFRLSDNELEGTTDEGGRVKGSGKETMENAG